MKSGCLRSLCILSVCLAVVCAIMTAVFLGERDLRCVTPVSGLLAVLLSLPLIPLLRGSKLPPPRYQRDVLLEDLGFETVVEHEGVQFAVLLLPDELHAPAYGVLALVLQNAHATPRTFRLAVTSTSLVMPGRALEGRLEGGHVRILTLPFLADGSLAEGDQTVKYAIDVKAPEAVGARVILRKGGVGAHAGGRTWALIRVVGRHADLPRHPQFKDLRLDAAIYRTGQEQPDLAPVQDLLKTA